MVKVESIYFGGGTPSLLNPEEIDLLTKEVRKKFVTERKAEITVEANPEDLTIDYLKRLRETAVNRVSIGCQSFNESILKMLNRRHTAGQAVESVINTFNAGFKNISVDLIYGLPGMDTEGLENTLKTALELPIIHFSAYHLTIERETVFYKWQQKGKIKPPDDEKSREQYILLTETARKSGYEHYEISNFAKNGFFSAHNLIYWLQKMYIGLGPSAHSYDGNTRQWNVSDISKYIDWLKQGKTYFEKEVLDMKMKFNEYLMTRLRTKWGIRKEDIIDRFGEMYYQKVEESILHNIDAGTMEYSGKNIRLTEQGMFISDYILSGLFLS